MFSHILHIHISCHHGGLLDEVCKSFRDENSAHKYCKDEASLHCEFSDVLSKLFCLTKAVKFNFKQCHCHFKVKQTLSFSISLTLMDHNISKELHQFIQIHIHIHTFKGSMATYLLFTAGSRTNISKETKHCPNIHLDNIKKTSISTLFSM